MDMKERIREAKSLLTSDLRVPEGLKERHNAGMMLLDAADHHMQMTRYMFPELVNQNPAIDAPGYGMILMIQYIMGFYRPDTARASAFATARERSAYPMFKSR